MELNLSVKSVPNMGISVSNTFIIRTLMLGRLWAASYASEFRFGHGRNFDRANIG
jgi:hypothetical protein